MVGIKPETPVYIKTQSKPKKFLNTLAIIIVSLLLGLVLSDFLFQALKYTIDHNWVSKLITDRKATIEESEEFERISKDFWLILKLFFSRIDYAIGYIYIGA